MVFVKFHLSQTDGSDNMVLMRKDNVVCKDVLLTPMINKNALQSKGNHSLVMILLTAVTLTFISELDLDMVVTYLHSKN